MRRRKLKRTRRTQRTTKDTTLFEKKTLSALRGSLCPLCLPRLCRGPFPQHQASTTNLFTPKNISRMGPKITEIGHEINSARKIPTSQAIPNTRRKSDAGRAGRTECDSIAVALIGVSRTIIDDVQS